MLVQLILNQTNISFPSLSFEFTVLLLPLGCWGEVEQNIPPVPQQDSPVAGRY